MTDQPNTDDPTIARPFTLDQLRDLLDVLREAHHRRAEIIARTRTALDYAKGYSIGVVVNLEQKADPIAWPSAGVPARHDHRARPRLAQHRVRPARDDQARTCRHVQPYRDRGRARHPHTRSVPHHRRDLTSTTRRHDTAGT